MILTSDLRFFRPVTKVKNINKCRTILDFKNIVLFLIHQGMWILRAIAILITFHTKTNQQHTHNFLMKSLITPHPHPQVHHDLTRCNNYTVDNGQGADNDEYRAGLCCKVKGLRYGREHNLRGQREDEERGSGMCT